MKLVISRRATQRLAEIADYIHIHNPAAARAVRSKLQATFDLIAARPYVGRPVLEKARRFAVPRLPYVIFYQLDIEAGEVTVLTVRHTAQQEEE